MSVMFDPDTAIYPFPPKPTPLSICLLYTS
ncbi:hypothetical protein, partial [Escherichia coli]